MIVYRFHMQTKLVRNFTILLKYQKVPVLDHLWLFLAFCLISMDKEIMKGKPQKHVYCIGGTHTFNMKFKHDDNILDQYHR